MGCICNRTSFNSDSIGEHQQHLKKEDNNLTGDILSDGFTQKSESIITRKTKVSHKLTEFNELLEKLKFYVGKDEKLECIICNLHLSHVWTSYYIAFNNDFAESVIIYLHF